VWTPTGAATSAHERVLENRQQVSDIVVGMKPAGLPENLRKSVLDQILGLLARSAHRARGAIQAIDVVSERGRIKEP
jgi:hypothetical protein